MKTHELKTWPVYYTELIKYTKRFEIRKNDRDFKTGDILVLQEWNPEGDGYYTGRYMVAEVTYLMQDDKDRPDRVESFGLISGWCAMGIETLKVHP